jgi:hypothetical protein
MDVRERPVRLTHSFVKSLQRPQLLLSLKLWAAHAFFCKKSSTASMQLEPEALKLIDILNGETKTHLKRCNYNNRLAEVLYKKQLP